MIAPEAMLYFFYACLKLYPWPDRKPANEHSEQARAPHTNGPRDVPRCGALSLLKKAAKRLDLIQTQVAQRRMQRVEVYARALRLSQHVK